jgi:tetratricopeptide (TPR) repeat protein
VNDSIKKKRAALALFSAAILLLSLGIARITSASRGEQEVCDVGADYALGIENYSEAIRLHIEVVLKHPENALAHYHPGFAEGMMGDRTAELSEYQRAAALALRNWDLFLNMGLAQLGNGDLNAATDSLRRMLASLQLNPGQLDARNMLGVIYAEQGKNVRASLTWRELTREAPDYEPAYKNLELLGGQSGAAIGETAAVDRPPRRPPSKPPKTNAMGTCRHPENSRDQRNQCVSHGRISSN